MILFWNQDTSDEAIEFYRNAKSRLAVLEDWLQVFQLANCRPGDSKWPFHPLVGGHLTP